MKLQKKNSFDDDSYDPTDSSYCPTEPAIYTLERNLPLNEAFQRLTLPRNCDMTLSNNSVNEFKITHKDTIDYGDDSINIALNTVDNDTVTNIIQSGGYY